MLSPNDFAKKQMIVVMAKDGERLSFANDNIVVTDEAGKVKLQCTCYRLFIVYVIGNCSITSVIMQKAKKFGFFIVFLSAGFRIQLIVGAEKDGNTMLKRNRNKSIYNKESIQSIECYKEKIEEVSDLCGLLAYEGLSSKLYFQNLYGSFKWNGRQPRIKRDAINATLDIGYTILFNFIDSLISCFGFDTYCGVLHREFYMRKSLVCDLVEPFRPIIDYSVKKALALNQIKEDDFIVMQGQYKLKWEKNGDYVKLLLMPLLERKEEIFKYIQRYYRAFMKESFEAMPFFEV